ncbi:MAG: hypothetical protein JXB48_06855, partial [Candidatus Latescibacteria bacterium]|nr:hypothetical protein [Candidatus Latescibacterota bacterium]
FYLITYICFFFNCIYGRADEKSYDTENMQIHSGSINPILKPSKYQTTIGYWNDNFIFEEILGNEIRQGKDDYVTASFWCQIAVNVKNKQQYIDVYHNILTNKTGNYRTDLLSIRYTFEKDTSIGSFRFGPGIISNGNFGGKNIQNGYHKIRGVPAVNLPYTGKENTGIIVYFKYQPELWSYKRLKCKGYVSNSFRSAVGPSNFRAGTVFDIRSRTVKRKYVFQFQVNTGYIDYYRSEKYISPLFDNGITWGTLFSAGIIQKFIVAAWITGNQYGLKQPHFGISMTCGWNGGRMNDLSDVAYP